MANEGLVWDPLLKKCNIPGGDDCILGPGGRSPVWFSKKPKAHQMSGTKVMGQAIEVSEIPWRAWGLLGMGLI